MEFCRKFVSLEGGYRSDNNYQSCVSGAHDPWKIQEKTYVGERDKRTKRSEWVVYENVNPPIVAKEVFDAVQRSGLPWWGVEGGKNNGGYPCIISA